MDWLVACVVAVVVGGLSNLLHSTPTRHREVVATIGMVAAAGGAAWWLWVASEPLTGLAAAVPWTLAAVLLAGTVVVVTERVPRLRGALVDRRMAEMSSAAFTVHVLVRIPIITALVEELLFRGLLWVLLDRAGGAPAALVGTSIAFSCSHVVVAAGQARREGRPVGRWVAVTLLATLVAGLLLGGVRILSDGLWAPAGVHAAVNAVLAVGARRAAAHTSPT